MIIDHDLEMSDDQTLAFNIGSAASTNVVDLVKAGIGRGTPVQVLCQLTADFDSSGDTGTLQVKLQTCASEDFSSTTVYTLVDTGALAQATCVKGYKPIDCALPDNVLQYLRLYYTIGTANGSGGTIEGGLVLDKQSNKQSVWA